MLLTLYLHADKYLQDNSICEKPFLAVRTFCATCLIDVIYLSTSDKGNITLLYFLINHLVDLINEDYLEIRIALFVVIKNVSILCPSKNCCPTIKIVHI